MNNCKAREEALKRWPNCFLGLINTNVLVSSAVEYYFKVGSICLMMKNVLLLIRLHLFNSVKL